MSSKSPQIFIYDDLHPEDGAMLQALYSRSPDSVVNHLEKVKKAGSGKFMSQYYVGYGHASIGDCGTTTIFMENYSMLAAKAIQDNPLYSGHEASTRYLDFAQQPPHNPYGHPAAQAILDGWMSLYNSTMPLIQAAIAQQHPFNATDYKTEKQWQNTVNARAFDIMRGFLPIGATTLFSWSTNLRQARDRLMQLKHHPLPEIQQLAQDLFTQLHQKYPNSFTGEEMSQAPRYAQRDAYAMAQAVKDNFITFGDILRQGHITSPQAMEDLKKGNLIVDRTKLDAKTLSQLEAQALTTRPTGAALSRRLASYGVYNLYFFIDFGSYRDLQRHRNGICQVPLAEDIAGIHPWYLQQVQACLSPEQYQAFTAHVAQLFQAIQQLPTQGCPTTKLANQYLYPMGLNILCHLAYSVPQMVYVAELRSQATVHATLRPIAQAMGQVLKSDFPNMALYIDTTPDAFTAKRGDQTIHIKAA